MRPIVIPLTYKYGEQFHLTPLGDIHFDSIGFDEKKFNQTLERNKIKNHRFILPGDIANWINKKDKRHTISEINPKYLGDNYINKVLKGLKEKLNGLAIDMISQGNHETKLLENDDIDVVELLCEMLNPSPQHGTYSGNIIYRMTHENGGGIIDLNVMYHHGAWGGSTNAVPPTAVRYADGFESWDLFLFGHSHRAGYMPQSKIRVAKPGTHYITRMIYYLNWGSYQRGYLDNLIHPTYAEKKGMRPAAIGSPMITWSVTCPKINNRSTRQLNINISSSPMMLDFQ